jgi:hypothetical protein
MFMNSSCIGEIIKRNIYDPVTAGEAEVQGSKIYLA